MQDNFTLTFNTGNAAFQEDKDGTPYEIQGILQKVVESLEAGNTSGPILDSNGNRIGDWTWK